MEVDIIFTRLDFEMEVEPTIIVEVLYQVLCEQVDVYKILTLDLLLFSQVQIIVEIISFTDNIGIWE
jgi:hypothetical protein